MPKLRVIVKSDEEEARVEEQKMIAKGYTATVQSYSTVMLDGSDLGGNAQFLQDMDGEAFVVQGVK